MNIVFEEVNIAKGCCDLEVVAHLMEAVIFNNGQPRKDVEFFEEVIKQTKEVLHMQLEVLENLNEM